MKVILEGSFCPMYLPGDGEGKESTKLPEV